jgi:hypothetical protein
MSCAMTELRGTCDGAENRYGAEIGDGAENGGGAENGDGAQDGILSESALPGTFPLLSRSGDKCPPPSRPKATSSQPASGPTWKEEQAWNVRKRASGCERTDVCGMDMKK